MTRRPLKRPTVVLLIVAVLGICLFAGCQGLAESYYIGNKNSKVFHRPSCSYLPAAENRVTFDTRQAAVNAGYSPCSHCDP